jgi:hypothetical protein
MFRQMARIALLIAVSERKNGGNLEGDDALGARSC